MGNQVDKLLTGWINIFNIIASSTQTVELAVKDLFDHLQSLPDKVDDIRKQICANDACLGPVIGDFFNKSE